MARPTARTRTRVEEPPRQEGLGEKVRRAKVGIAILVLVVVGIGALLYFDEPLPGIEFPSQGNQHISSVADPHVAYNSAPPSSGPHVGALAQWGVHDEPIPPELFVHNLEDGGVILAYDCPEECPELVEGLSEYTDRGRVVVMPYSGIVDPDGVAHRGAAVAWTRVLYFDELDQGTRDEIGVFIDLFEGVDHHTSAN